MLAKPFLRGKQRTAISDASTDIMHHAVHGQNNKLAKFSDLLNSPIFVVDKSDDEAAVTLGCDSFLISKL